ncbi:hypothetical protein E8E12_008758 [Didymella heteroderae]|uniref:Heterokaryon incompatibility domain-containing protein n=1 Tax=Didymella heteroderae TaxID=1769908 RepID=A0A9P4WQA2_9PLEO|nr:hypothetical protein E8E12_008758 [Didymella heteroderae]
MSPPSSGFQYTPLTQPKQEIRLVQIVPGSGSIELTLDTYEISEDLNYVALSYEWASEEDPEEISVNGAALQLRQNLCAALLRVRSWHLQKLEDGLFDDPAPQFWIDAVCINQADVMERGHQVAMMGRIFRQASQTIAWLSTVPEPDGIELLGRAMSFMTKGLESRLHGPREIRKEETALRLFCAQSYFSRIWIVQEVLLARRLHFFCGPYACSWEDLVIFWKLKDHQGYIIAPSLWVDDLSLLSEELVDAKERFGHDLDHASLQINPVKLLEVARHRHCADFRDRVYAFLGLLQQALQPVSFEIDYQSSLEVLMIRTATWASLSSPQSNDGKITDSIVEAFRRESKQVENLGWVTWYWKIMQILHCLDAKIIGGFHRIQGIEPPRNRSLTIQLLSWILGAYGINLVETSDPSVDNSQELKQYTETAVVPDIDKRQRKFTTIWELRNPSSLSYCIMLETVPWPPYMTPDEYNVTEHESQKCRELLRTHNANFEELLKLQDRVLASPREIVREIGKSDLMCLPEQVEIAVAANLLARQFTAFWNDAGRNADLGRFSENFSMQGDPKSSDLTTFLSNSLFSKYRVEVREGHDDDDSSPPTGMLQSVEVYIYDNLGSNEDLMLAPVTK